MGVNTTSVRLCSFLPHQLSLGTRTVFTPTCREPILKGPVPLTLLLAKFSTFVLTLAGFSAPLAVAHALLMMSVEVIWTGRIGLGLLMTRSTVRSSIFLTSVTDETV